MGRTGSGKKFWIVSERDDVYVARRSIHVCATADHPMKKTLLPFPEHFVIHATALINKVHQPPAPTVLEGPPLPGAVLINVLQACGSPVTDRPPVRRVIRRMVKPR
jgi:hypothetical protein